MRRRSGLVTGLLATALVLAACGTAEAPRSSLVAELFPGTAGAAQADQPPTTARTVSVYVTEAGYDPAAINVRVGESIELVLRNVGFKDHQYRVAGMPARDLQWLDQTVVDFTDGATSAAPDAAAAAHDHEHGAGGLVPLSLAKSSSGGLRRGDELDAQAYAGRMDVVLFTPTKPGTYTVRDALHPQIVGRLVVSP